VGNQFEPGSAVKILLVGGAAAMVTGLLPSGRTTVDCDVMVYEPEQSGPAVEVAAEQAAEELGLAPTWLNSDVQIRRDTLPAGWQGRRIHVGTYGRLHVYAASRPDLIAMRVLAGRAQDVEDLEDLEAMKMTEDEVDFVRSHLGGLAEKGTHADQVQAAYALLDSLKRDRL
jgi:hypothetical protein